MPYEKQVMNGRYEYTAAFIAVLHVAKFVCHRDIILYALLLEIVAYQQLFVVDGLHLFFFS